ncbi:MAG: hypothetical protein ABI461_23825, partial [Polyangiaceae bacterium]
LVPPGDGSTTGDGSPENDSSVPFDAGPLCGTKHCFGGTCSTSGAGGVCQPIAVYTEIGLDPSVIDADDRYVYFASGVNKLVRLDPTNGATLSLATSEPNLSDLTVSGANVYFTNGGISGSTVSSCSINGCAGSGNRVDFVVGSNASFFGIAADATNVYFTSDKGGGGVQKCTISGGAPCTPVQIATSANAHSLFELGGTLYWDDDSSSANGVFSCSAASCTKSGGADSTLVTAIAANSVDVFYTTQTTVNKRVISSGVKSQVIINRTNVVAVAADEKFVYWVDASSGSSGLVQRCQISNDCTVPANVETMAMGLNHPADLVVTADSVYFTDTDNGKVWRVAK